MTEESRSGVEEERKKPNQTTQNEKKKTTTQLFPIFQNIRETGWDYYLSLIPASSVGVLWEPCITAALSCEVAYRNII